MADVTFTVDGKKLTAPAGMLLIDACRKAGIEIPAFCYYPGLSLQAACRMCVVRQEKVPKLQTACTTTVAEGQVFITESAEITQARKATIELLLGNHPLDCPVCDAGGECELQDMTFKYGAGESLYVEAKQHREEQQWSPAVYFDRPRCILCYRCVRMCGEGMDVWALGIQNRGASATIAPNGGDHLDCEQCGMCIDACPVGALDQRDLSLQDAALGDEPRFDRLHPLRRRLQGHAGHAPGGRRHGDHSRRQPRQIRHQRRFSLRQGPLWLRFCRVQRPVDASRWCATPPASWSRRPGSRQFAWSRPSSKRFATRQGKVGIGVIGSNTTTNEENYLCRSSRGRCFRPTTSTMCARPTTRALPRLSRERLAAPPACAIPRRPRPSC
jgi:predicted molibdopterin-dependent oxidoreductase YjgC